MHTMIAVILLAGVFGLAGALGTMWIQRVLPMDRTAGSKGRRLMAAGTTDRLNRETENALV
jgi:hypothetical protein